MKNVDNICEMYVPGSDTAAAASALPFVVV